ncbi:hypothetical protein FE257_011760 [Aspergillus nanangensis]|uniref:Uncharacterized protein n=1 Tax=Aspergillus nanangensis TaxID=2582783 RepID=A0AAD4CWZ1_ASPNN|nr:hypothetical protein FE257_011760 [Aspergillus nanangensis]
MATLQTTDYFVAVGKEANARRKDQYGHSANALRFCVFICRENIQKLPAMLSGSIPSHTKDRVRILESQVNDLYHALRSTASRDNEASPDISNSYEGILVISNVIMNVTDATTSPGFLLSE